MHRAPSLLCIALIAGILLMLVAVPNMAVGQLADTPSPRAGFDQANSRQSDFGAEPETWTVELEGTGDRSLSWPVIASDGALVLVDSFFEEFEEEVGSPVVVVLEPDGSTRWSVAVDDFPGQAIGAPAITEDDIIIAAFASTEQATGLIAVFDEAGEFGAQFVDELAEFNEGDLSADRRGGAAQTPLLDTEGRLFVRMEGTLLAFDVPDDVGPDNLLEELWRVDIGFRCLNIGPDNSIYGATGSDLFRLDPDSGDLLSEPIPVNAQQEGCPAIDDDGNVYVSNGVEVERWDPTLTELEWASGEGVSAPLSTPVLSPDQTALYFHGQPDEISATSLIALDTSTGDQLWSVEGEEDLLDGTAPSVSSDGLIFFSATGEPDPIEGPRSSFFAVNQDGELVLTQEFTTPNNDAPILVGPPILSSTGGVYQTASGSSFDQATHLQAFPLPRVTVSDEELDFGPVEIGQSASQTFVLENDSEATLIVEELALDDPAEAFSVSIDEEELDPGTSAEVEVNFEPPSAGLIEGVLSIITNLGTVEVTLSGEGTRAVAPGIWPRQGFDAANTRTSPFGGGSSWIASFASLEASTPAIAEDGTLYLVVEDELVARSSDGDELWRTTLPIDTEQSAPVPPVIATDGTIYVFDGSLAGVIAAVDPDGEFLWEWQRSEVPAQVNDTLPGLILTDTGLLLASDGFDVFAVEPLEDDASFLWERFTRTEAPLGCLAASSDGAVVYLVDPVLNGGTLEALDADTGEELWALEEVAPAPACPAIDEDGTLYLFDQEEDALAVVSDDGDLLDAWFLTPPQSPESFLTPTAGGDGSIYFAANYAGGNGEEPFVLLQAVDDVGAGLWVEELRGAGGDGLAVDTDGNLHLGLQVSQEEEVFDTGEGLTLNAATGGFVQRYTSSDGLAAAPVVAGDGTAYFLGQSTTGDNMRSLHAVQMSELAASTESVDFGAVEVGSDAVDMLELTNAGPASIRVEDIQFGDGDATPFAFDMEGEAALPVELEPDESLQVDVSFAPQAPNASEVFLIVTREGQSIPISLRGEGREVNVTFDDAPLVSGVDAELEIDVAGVAPDEAQLLFRSGGEAQVDTVEMAVEGSVLFGTVPGSFVTARGVDFAVEMVETGNQFRVPSDESAFFHRRVALSAVAADGPFEPETYRMISLPFEATSSGAGDVLGDLGSPDPDIWRLLRWSPSEEAYEEFPEREFALDPGLAFWLITRDGDSFDVTEATTVPAAEPFSLSLEPGWNQIGVPYGFAVPWSEVTIQGEDPLSFDVEPPVAFDGQAYIPEIATLDPWDGYFVFNGSGEVVELEIPAVSVEQVPNSVVADAEPSEGDSGFGFRVLAEANDHDAGDPHTYLLMNGRASDSPVDLQKAPAVGRILQTGVVDEDRGLLARHVLPWSDEGGVWELEIAQHGAAALEQWNVELSLEILGELPGSFEWQVLLTDTGEVLGDSDGTLELRLGPGQRSQRVRVVVGTPEFLADQEASLDARVQGLDVQQPYPNPFRTEATLNFELGDAEYVRIFVYDALGRRITTLMDGPRPPGSHTVVWKGTDATGQPVASGVYLYRIEAGDHTYTGSFTRVR